MIPQRDEGCARAVVALVNSVLSTATKPNEARAAESRGFLENLRAEKGKRKPENARQTCW